MIPDEAVEGMELVLIAHQRYSNGGCLCGWSELGRSHPEHQALALRASGFGKVQK